MLAAILVAGRSGSSITAQIGVMRVTEELDAMRVMGIPHGFSAGDAAHPGAGAGHAAHQRVDHAGRAGRGMLAADITLGISPSYFVQAPARRREGGQPRAGGGQVGGVRGLIALIGCHWGLRVKPNTQSLGEGTTASVVTSITMVIIVDAIFAVAFRNVGI